VRDLRESDATDVIGKRQSRRDVPKRNGRHLLAAPTFAEEWRGVSFE